MIPKFLKEYEEELEKYKREFVKIEAESLAITALIDNLDIKTSKFLGKPFYPKSKVYPTDRNGKPMLLTAQLNFEEIPNIANLPNSGILQLFLSGTDWYDEESMIVYHSKSQIVEESITDFSFINEGDYDEMPIQEVHKLSFNKSIENGGFGDNQFDFRFGGMDWYDFLENLTENEQAEFNDYFEAGGHKLGGYAEFTQSDPRDYKGRNESDFQLLQIDSIGDIMFGDVGLGHVFISLENIEKEEFDKAYFTWDCC